MTQAYSGSLGYALPAAFGGAMVERDIGRKGRVVIVVGDGGLQLSVQEMSSVVKEGLDVIL